MVASVFDNQMDFIRLAYGLALVLLASVCVPLLRNAAGMPWKWLCLFGITYGLRQWCALFAISMGHVPTLEYARIVLTALSLAMLVEFARAGTVCVNGRGPGRWILAPLGCAAAFGCFAGLSGVDACVRHVLGPTGGLWSAHVLWRHRQVHHPRSKALLVAAAGTAVYGLLVGTMVRPAPFLPGSVINQEAFLATTGMPVHLISLAVVLSIAVAVHYHYQSYHPPAPACAVPRQFGGFHLALSLTLTLSVGGATTNRVGRIANDDARRELLDHTRLAAVAIDPENLRQLTATKNDIDTRPWRAVREQLGRIAAADPWLGHPRTLLLRDGRIFCSCDPAPENSPHCNRPGRPCEFISPQFPEVFQTGQAITVGPYTGRRGTVISSLVPIGRPNDGSAQHALAVDVDAATWQRLVAGRRLAPLAVTLVVCLLLIGFFVIHQVSVESAIRELTDRRAAEEFRQRAERDLRTIFDNVHDAILVHDVEGRLLDFNDRMLRLYGVSREEAATLSIADDYSSPDNPVSRLPEIWRRVFEGQPQEFEWIARRPHDGHCFPVEMSLRKIELADREVILANVRDITHRKVAEQSLRESEERLNLALSGADLGLWDWNVQTGEMHFDERWAGMLGYSPDELEPYVHTWKDLIHPDDAPAVTEALRAHFEARTPTYEIEYRLRNKSGEWLWILARGRVMIRSRSGKPLRMTGTHLNITSRREAEYELQKARTAADAATSEAGVATGAGRE